MTGNYTVGLTCGYWRASLEKAGRQSLGLLLNLNVTLRHP